MGLLHSVTFQNFSGMNWPIFQIANFRNSLIVSNKLYLLRGLVHYLQEIEIKIVVINGHENVSKITVKLYPSYPKTLHEGLWEEGGNSNP